MESSFYTYSTFEQTLPSPHPPKSFVALVSATRQLLHFIAGVASLQLKYFSFWRTHAAIWLRQLWLLACIKAPAPVFTAADSSSLVTPLCATNPLLALLCWHAPQLNGFWQMTKITELEIPRSHICTTRCSIVTWAQVHTWSDKFVVLAGVQIPRTAARDAVTIASWTQGLPSFQ